MGRAERNPSSDSWIEEAYAMGLKQVAAIGSAILAAFIAGAALADIAPACPSPPGAKAVSLENAPVALRKLFGDYAPPGAYFDSGDVVITGQNRGLIFIWGRGDRWIVATEHGGRGSDNPIFAFHVSPDGSSARQLSGSIAGPNTVCSTALRMMGANP
jgi:hypothetical protein